jgi:hypothetical protein
MLETLVALDLAQRLMKDQFETGAGAKVGRVERERRSPFRAASALVMGMLAPPKPRSSGARQPACPEGSGR